MADADRRRVEQKPFTRKRSTADIGVAEPYGWSEDVMRQYSRPERAAFGVHVRARDFRLD